ncbi:hypothetical protein ACFUIV_01890 [Streptomyces anulatus]|uniref:hypothetical protein n=1 Tax=Streptomyces anulatus TaxID=1892 RepID=UPI0036280173
MRIELHIGRIVLEGVDPREATAVRAALEAELTTLLTRTPLTSHHTHRTATPVLPLATTPAAFGQALARAVHGALTHHVGGGR